MHLYEFQAKQIFKDYGIPTSDGRVATTAEDAVRISEELARPVTAKAQVLCDGRGSAQHKIQALRDAGTLIADSPRQIPRLIQELGLSNL